MRLGEFARDMTQAPSSEDRVVAVVNGEEFEVGAVQFIDGRVRILTGEGAVDAPPVALAEQTAADQSAFGGDSTPGHADVMHERASGAGIASDLRDGNVKTEPEKSGDWSDRGQEYHAGPEQPAAPVVDEQVAEDSGT